MTNTCRVPNCDRPRAKVKTGHRTLCTAHFGRLSKHGDVMADVPIRESRIDSDVCAVEICDRPRQPIARGRSRYCGAHLQRHTKRGDLRADVPIRVPSEAVTCRVEGCDRPRDANKNGAHSLCGAHRNRWRRYGDVLADTPIAKRRPRGTGGIIDGYVYRYLPDHPLANKKGRVREHRVVLFGVLGPGEHPCHWCGKLVSWDIRRGLRRLEVDHVNAIRDDNRPENLVPSCPTCNSKRANGAVLLANSAA